MDDRSIEKLTPQIEAEEHASQTRDNLEQAEERPDAVGQAQPRNDQDEQKLHDEIDSLYYGDGYSEYSKGSRRSQFTSATYISKLEKELQDEKSARERLEKELEEIKKISSEISSHLGLGAKK